MELCEERSKEKEVLHKKISELEIIVKNNEGMKSELQQAKTREKDLQQIAEDAKLESDNLRAKLMMAGSGNSRLGLRLRQRIR